MFKRINYLLLGLMMNGGAFSNQYVITQSNDIYLYPAEPTEISNPTESTIKATCDVRLAKEEHHSILFNILQGGGVFNDIVMKVNDPRWISFYDKTQIVPVTIAPNTVAKLTNYGEFTIRLICRD